MDRQVRQAGLTSHDWQERAIRSGNFDILVEAAKSGRRIHVEKFVSTFDTTTGIYRFEVDFDETLEKKVGHVDDNTIGWSTPYAVEEKFPDKRTGRQIVEAKIVFPDRYTSQNDSAIANGLCPKELVALARAFPRPALDEHMPLVAPGQFWTDAGGNRFFLYLSRNGAGRELDVVWLNRDAQWNDHWRFLVRARPLVP
jgi:hypothetical protein